MSTPDPNDMDTWPVDLREAVLTRDAEIFDMNRHFLEDYEFEVRDGIVYEKEKEGCLTSGSDCPIHSYFGLSYASWLAIPRLTLQEMPKNWQARFVALLHEMEDLGVLHRPECKVTVVGENGKYRDGSHWHNYRRGTVADALATDKRLDAQDKLIAEARRQNKLRAREEEIATRNAEVLGTTDV